MKFPFSQLKFCFLQPPLDITKPTDKFWLRHHSIYFCHLVHVGEGLNHFFVTPDGPQPIGVQLSQQRVVQATLFSSVPAINTTVIQAILAGIVALLLVSYKCFCNT